MVLLILLCIIKSTTIIPVPPRNKGGWRCNLCLHLVQPPSHSTGTWCCQFDLHGSGRIAFLLFFFHCSSLWDSAHLDWQPVAVGWFLQHTSTWVCEVCQFFEFILASGWSKRRRYWSRTVDVAMISMVTWWHYPYSYHYHYPYHYHCHDGHLAASLCCLLPSTAGVARLGARTSARIMLWCKSNKRPICTWIKEYQKDVTICMGTTSA